MAALLSVVLPVFMVMAAGYACVRLNYFSDGVIDGVTKYTQNFAIPCLLFKAAMTLDFGAVFDPRLLASFYAGNTITFILGILGARAIFRRRPGEAVAIGFGALFSNSVILGIPIVERAYGGAALTATLAIVAIHAPFCYTLGITTMEISRADGRSMMGTLRAVLNAMRKNALLVGLALGFAVNFSGLRLPVVMLDGLDMIVRSALPVALFSLGGILTRYHMRASLGAAGMIATLSLIVHPIITYMLAAEVFELSDMVVKGAVITAAMAPGVNTYVFATLYGRAQDVAATTVLLATLISVFSVSVWLNILG